MVFQQLPCTEFWQMSFYDSWNTYNTLLNFKCKNITIKRSDSEKLLGVVIDNKLDFTEHFNTVCKKASLKLHALNRISRFLSPEQHVLIINAYIKSLFNYCPLVWIFCSWEIMHKMNKIHERSLSLLLKTTRIILKIFWGPLVIRQSIKDV